MSYDEGRSLAQVPGIDRQETAEAPRDSVPLEELRHELYPHQRKALTFMRQREEESSGGFVLDPMGFGKTLLVYAHALGTYRGAPSRRADYCVTLIVVTNIEVWQLQARKHLTPRGLERIWFVRKPEDIEAMRRRPGDVVVTTYWALIASHGTAALEKLAWLRVILDEAHIVRNSSAKVHRAVVGLRAWRRWAVTGTVWNNTYRETSTIVQWVYGKETNVSEAFARDAICRTFNDASVRLEPFRVYRIPVHAYALERRFYGALSKLYAEKHLSLLLRGRQAGAHFYLVLAHVPALREAWEQRYARVRERGERCAISVEEVVDIATECMSVLVGDRPLTPPTSSSSDDDDADADVATGAAGSAVDQLLSIHAQMTSERREWRLARKRGKKRKEAKVDGTTTSTPDAFIRWLPPFASSKMAHFWRLYEQWGATEKFIVFSQWVQALDLMATMLFPGDASRCYVMYTGAYSSETRAASLESFQSDPTVRVIFMTLKLAEANEATAASRIFVLDSWWNPSSDEQAICRAHRPGQQRTVHVYYMYDAENAQEARVEDVRTAKINMRDASREEVV